MPQLLEDTIADRPYKSGGFWDYIVESFAGTHDTIGGDITDIYMTSMAIPLVGLVIHKVRCITHGAP